MNCLKRNRFDSMEPSFDNGREGSYIADKRLRMNGSYPEQNCSLQVSTLPVYLLPSLFMKYYGIQGSTFERYVNELD